MIPTWIYLIPVLIGLVELSYYLIMKNEKVTEEKTYFENKVMAIASVATYYVLTGLVTIFVACDSNADIKEGVSFIITHIVIMTIVIPIVGALIYGFFRVNIAWGKRISPLQKPEPKKKTTKKKNGKTTTTRKPKKS